MGQQILAVPMGLRPTNRDENQRESLLHLIKWRTIGRGRGCSGEVEADWLSDPERAFEQMSVRRSFGFAGVSAVRDRA